MQGDVLTTRKIEMFGFNAMFVQCGFHLMHGRIGAARFIRAAID